MSHVRRPGRCIVPALAIALVLGLGVASPARAEVKVGYVDSQLIFQQFKDAQQAQQRFDRQVQGWKDEAAEKEKAVNVLRAEMRDQAAILSQVKRQEKEETLQRAISEYERFVQDIWGPQGRAAQENERATSDVVAQIRAAVEKVAAGRGLELVLDSAGGFIIYADKSLDLTPQVIQELNTRTTGTSR